MRCKKLIIGESLYSRGGERENTEIIRALSVIFRKSISVAKVKSANKD